MRVCRDVYGGTLHLQDLAGTYLPQFPKEDDEVYAQRVKAAVLFNAYRRTVGGLVGMVMRKQPKLEGVPKEVEGHFEDIDLAGRNLTAFADDASDEAWVDGHSVIFVDKPPVPEGWTKDQAAHLRPYWVLIRADDILGASTERRDGVDVVTRLRWREETVEVDPKDEFKEVAVPRVREYRLVSAKKQGSEEIQNRVEWRTWELRRSEKNELRWVPGEGGFLGPQMDEIPIGVIYTNREGVLDSEPPLLDLATENLRHFRKLSDKDNSEHIGCVPIFTTIGAPEDDIKGFSIGPTIGLALPQGADAKYVETSGSGSSVNRESLKDSEHRMALLGLSTLHPDPKWGVTATASRIDKSESDSQLGAFVLSLEHALNTAKRLHLKWMGIEDTGKIIINRDFEALRMDAQTVLALADLVPAKMSLETFWGLMQQGGILPDTFDPERERERLESVDMDDLAQLMKKLKGRVDPDDVDEDVEE